LQNFGRCGRRCYNVNMSPNPQPRSVNLVYSCARVRPSAIRGNTLRTCDASDSSHDAFAINVFVSSLTLKGSVKRIHLSLTVQTAQQSPTATSEHKRKEPSAAKLKIPLSTNLVTGKAPPFRISSLCVPRRPVIWEYPSCGLGQRHVGTRRCSVRNRWLLILLGGAHRSRRYFGVRCLMWERWIEGKRTDLMISCGRRRMILCCVGSI
jgi:hypothetical protein